MTDTVRRYYQDNPLMVSSPFGGVDSVNRALFDSVFDELNIAVDGCDILDVGCGRGYVGEWVSEKGGQYTGVDFVRSRGGFRLALADSARLPFPDASFDRVFCIDAFEHFPDIGQAAREFRRVLRPGGVVFLSVPNYANVAGIVKKYCEVLGHYEKDTWAPFRQWQPQELESALTSRRVRTTFKQADFRVLRRVGYGPDTGLGLCPWIAHKRMPESLMFRLQRLFATIGPMLVRLWPDASLHGFWKIEV